MLLRLVAIDDQPYLEFVFTDITQILLTERKTTINSCKNNYLAKIAHEVSNPLCLILQLSEDIKEETKKQIQIKSDIISNCSESLNNLSNEVDFTKIRLCSKNITNICNLMNYLMQDFFLTSSFDEFCIVCEKTINLCAKCGKAVVCILCNVCQYCRNLKNHRIFNYLELIHNCVNVFHTKKQLEGRDFKIAVSDPPNQKDYAKKINNNEDYLSSLIFNLLYLIYKKNKSKEVYIKSNYLNYTDQIDGGQYCFEIIETNNLNLFKNSMINKYYSYDEYMRNKSITSNYETMVHLYNAFILSRKLGSDNLFIEVNEGGIKYSLNAKNYEKTHLSLRDSKKVEEGSSKFFLNLKKNTQITKKLLRKTDLVTSSFKNLSLSNKDFDKSESGVLIKNIKKKIHSVCIEKDKLQLKDSSVTSNEPKQKNNKEIKTLIQNLNDRFINFTFEAKESKGKMDILSEREEILRKFCFKKGN